MRTNVIKRRRAPEASQRKSSAESNVYRRRDHSMLTAMRAVENIDGADHDLWSVNADSWYHESEEAEERPYRRAPVSV